MKALLAGLMCLLLLSSCSKKTDAELYREGVAAEEQHNLRLAIERYHDVVERNSDRAFAESSQYRIAMIYTNDSDKQKAVDAHRQFCQMFPDSKQTPTMLFLLGFLYNNDLHKIDSARSVYQLFLQKYPAHELAKSAQFEIDNLGKNPEEYLKQHLSAGETPAKRTAPAHK